MILIAAFALVIGTKLFLALTGMFVKDSISIVRSSSDALTRVLGNWALKAEVKAQFASLPPRGTGPYGIFVFDEVPQPPVSIAFHACSMRCAQSLLSRVGHPKRIEEVEGPGVCDQCRAPFE